MALLETINLRAKADKIQGLGLMLAVMAVVSSIKTEVLTRMPYFAASVGFH
jgi:hypothetical protein